MADREERAVVGQSWLYALQIMFYSINPFYVIHDMCSHAAAPTACPILSQARTWTSKPCSLAATKSSSHFIRSPGNTVMTVLPPYWNQPISPPFTTLAPSDLSVQLTEPTNNAPIATIPTGVVRPDADGMLDSNMRISRRFAVNTSNVVFTACGFFGQNENGPG